MLANLSHWLLRQKSSPGSRFLPVPLQPKKKPRGQDDKQSWYEKEFNSIACAKPHARLSRTQLLVVILDAASFLKIRFLHA
jgi:hypothetical protein